MRLVLFALACGAAALTAGLTNPRGFASGVAAAAVLVTWLVPRQRSTWTSATVITLARGVLVTAVASFVAVAEPAGGGRWLPAALYGLAVLLDGVDGALARRRGEVTELGAGLDVTVDALGILVASLLAVRWGTLPPWYLALGGLYYVERAVELGARVRRLGVRLPKRPLVRVFAGLQMALVTAALVPGVPPGGLTLVASLVMAPTCAVFAHDIAARLGLIRPWTRP